MKLFLKTLCLGAIVAVAPLAKADSITGSIKIGGSDTFTATGISFNPSTATVDSSSISTNGFSYTGFTAKLNSFTFDNAAGVTAFSVDNGISTLKFTITSIFTPIFGGAGTPGSTFTAVNVFGEGIFSETLDGGIGTLGCIAGNLAAGKGAQCTTYTNTNANFSLSSSNSGVTSFTINGVTTAATPEPNSLVLLGTGLVSAAGMLSRRRRRTGIAA